MVGDTYVSEIQTIDQERLEGIKFPHLFHRMVCSYECDSRAHNWEDSLVWRVEEARQRILDLKEPSPGGADPGDLRTSTPSVFGRAVKILEDAMIRACQRAKLNPREPTKQRGCLSLRDRVDKLTPIVDCNITVLEGSLLLAQDNDGLHRDSGSRQLRYLKKIRQQFDIALFLPLDEEEALQRKFRRPDYDRFRKPGEWWKTKGYFTDVVW